MAGPKLNRKQAMIEDQAHRRSIRSFVRRGGRTTVGQERALARLLPRYGTSVRGTADPVALFARDAPLCVEIGFGDGECLVETAARHPEVNFLGVEVHRPGIGHALLAVENRRLANVRIVEADAAELLACGLPAASVSVVNIFFPDPWPKKRHHKRRLIQPDFAAALGRILRPGGILHLATDWPPYAEHMAQVLGAQPGLSPLAPAEADAITSLAARLQTKFERRGLHRGHEIRDLYYLRMDDG